MQHSTLAAPQRQVAKKNYDVMKRGLHFQNCSNKLRKSNNKEKTTPKFFANFDIKFTSMHALI